MNTAVDPLQARTCELLRVQFGRSARVLGVAPGRVELLGNHTDHNRGLVLAAAIDRTTCVAAAPNDMDRVRIWSDNVKASDEFVTANIGSLPRGAWSNYVRAALAGLANAGLSLRGFDAVIASDVPLGGGLSSSASLECAMAMAVIGLFGAVSGGEPSGMALAQLMQEWERRIVGVECGILDQFSSIFGHRGHALFLDCDTLGQDSAPLGADPPAIVVCDSGVSRQLATGKYNERRRECEAALEEIRRLCDDRSYRSLSDVPLAAFVGCQEKIEPILACRARHVLTENDRVRRGFEILRQSGALSDFGQLMFESHRSSRDDFENSSKELDILIEIASRQPGCLGAKLSGAGWGGCTVSLVERGVAESFARTVSQEYTRRTSIEPAMMICQAADGARTIRL